MRPLLAVLVVSGCFSPAGSLAPSAVASSVSVAPVCVPVAPVLSIDAGCAARGDALDDALAHLSLDRCRLGFTAQDYGIFGGAPWLADAARLPWFDAAHDPAVNAPVFARRLVSALDETLDASVPVSAAVLVAGASYQATPPPCFTPTLRGGASPLADAVIAVVRRSGAEPDVSAITDDASDVPLELQRALAELVDAAREANEAWEVPMARRSAPQRALLVTSSNVDLTVMGGRPDLRDAATLRLLTRDFDLGALVTAATRLSMRVEAQRLERFAGLSGFSFDQATPMGRVVLRDAANDELRDDGGSLFVVLDTGGDDTYLAPVGAIVGDPTTGRHTSLAVDLAGKDTYGYPVVADRDDGCPAAAPREWCRLPSDRDGRYHSTLPPTDDQGPVSLSMSPRQGAARLGFGFLFDLGSEGDTYRSLRMSQGYGASGVGVLYDRGGDDRYEAEAAAQGAGAFGLGLLIDDQGNDTYRLYTHGQGYAFVHGVGVLVDRSGDDRYHGNTGDPDAGGDPIYRSVQIPGRANDNFVQGAGFGFNSVASGGLGVLRDAQGNDDYLAAVYAQATGYWFGAGVLADGAGRDRYNGRYYVQGSGAHFGLAVFLEDDGDDTYNLEVAPRATSIGIGHDFTVSWHLDLGGNDRYRGPGLSLGGGNANGLGVLINAGGDDSYEAPGEPCLGVANLSSEVNTSAARRGVPTFGVFLDLGGADAYRAGSSQVARADDTRWINNREPAASGLTTEFGVGVDRADGAVSFPR